FSFVFPRIRFLGTAAEVAGVVRIAAAVVLRVLWIWAQRTAATWEGAAGRCYRLGRRVLFHPIDGCREEVERIECRAAAGTMSHAGRKKQAAPVPHLRLASTGLAHALVI